MLFREPAVSCYPVCRLLNVSKNIEKVEFVFSDFQKKAVHQILFVCVCGGGGLRMCRCVHVGTSMQKRACASIISSPVVMMAKKNAFSKLDNSLQK